MMAEWRRSSRVNFTSMLSMRGLANHLIWYSEFDQVSESVFCANKLIYFNIALLGNDSASSLCLQSQICGLKLHKHMSWLQFMTQSKSGLMCFFLPMCFSCSALLRWQGVLWSWQCLDWKPNTQICIAVR